MGLKWFRARLTMRRVPKSTTCTLGFYRSMSQFDSDGDCVQPSASRENRVEPSIHTVPTSPVSIAAKPSADQELETPPIRQRNPETVARSNSEEPESPDDSIRIPRHLPRESIEILRSGSAEGSPRQLVARSRKQDFKKKKGRAPLPSVASSNATEDNGKSASVNKARSSDGSEIEI